MTKKKIEDYSFQTNEFELLYLQTVDPSNKVFKFIARGIPQLILNDKVLEVKKSKKYTTKSTTTYRIRYLIDASQLHVLYQRNKEFKQRYFYPQPYKMVLDEVQSLRTHVDNFNKLMTKSGNRLCSLVNTSDTSHPPKDERPKTCLCISACSLCTNSHVCDENSVKTAHKVASQVKSIFELEKQYRDKRLLKHMYIRDIQRKFKEKIEELDSEKEKIKSEKTLTKDDQEKIQELRQRAQKLQTILNKELNLDYIPDNLPLLQISSSRKNQSNYLLSVGDKVSFYDLDIRPIRFDRQQIKEVLGTGRYKLEGFKGLSIESKSSRKIINPCLYLKIQEICLKRIKVECI